MRTKRQFPSKIWLAAMACFFLGASIARAQPAKPELSAAGIASLVDQVTRYQLDDYFHHPSWNLRYRVHRKDSKEDTVRDLVETPEGNVARTIERNGQPLSTGQQAAEDQRLRNLTAGELERHHRGSLTSDKFGAELIRAMPRAMTYTLAPGQPQLAQFPGEQIVLDYAPNPQFHPEGTVQDLLTGLAGRIWIDAETHHLVRMEINVFQDLNLAFGMLARVYRGGKIIFEQRPVSGGHYAFSHIAIDVRLRELMVKTVPYQLTLDATDVIFLPAAPSLPDAIQLLLHGPSGSAVEHHE